jgi:hypothetical protein
MNKAFSRRKFLQESPHVVSALASLGQARAAAPERPGNQQSFNARQFVLSLPWAP